MTDQFSFAVNRSEDDDGYYVTTAWKGQPVEVEFYPDDYLEGQTND
jgi:hypothetical protein